MTEPREKRVKSRTHRLLRPTKVGRAYAKRSPEIERMVVAALVSDFSIRKVWVLLGGATAAQPSGVSQSRKPTMGSRSVQLPTVRLSGAKRR